MSCVVDLHLHLATFSFSRHDALSLVLLFIVVVNPEKRKKRGNTKTNARNRIFFATETKDNAEMAKSNKELESSFYRERFQEDLEKYN